MTRQCKPGHKLARPAPRSRRDCLAAEVIYSPNRAQLFWISSSVKRSAGILMFHLSGRKPMVLLVHPGGPYWRNKDRNSWSIPKGEFGDDETAEAAAIRAFEEETDFPEKSASTCRAFRNKASIRLSTKARVRGHVTAPAIPAARIIGSPVSASRYLSTHRQQRAGSCAPGSLLQSEPVGFTQSKPLATRARSRSSLC
jgi:8-oxo-dGTP pyrophosphatase MutT (NUDIX family)